MIQCTCAKQESLEIGECSFPNIQQMAVKSDRLKMWDTAFAIMAPSLYWIHKDEIDIDLHTPGITTNKQAAKMLRHPLIIAPLAFYSPQLLTEYIAVHESCCICCSKHWVSLESVFAKEIFSWWENDADYPSQLLINERRKWEAFPNRNKTTIHRRIALAHTNTKPLLALFLEPRSVWWPCHWKAAQRSRCDGSFLVAGEHGESEWVNRRDFRLFWSLAHRSGRGVGGR